MSTDLVDIAARLRDRVAELHFAPPVACVYNPLAYAWQPHQQYLQRYGGAPKEAVFVGMNPGPFGMAQTGVPFGDVAMVRDWLGILATVTAPQQQHPKRPVLGFACTRREVSGGRLWGWAQQRFGTPQAFFARFMVLNYCPLAFVGSSGKNLTPDKLPRAEQQALFACCDSALRDSVLALQARWVIGVGSFAFQRAAAVFDPPAGASTSTLPRVGHILHPSPASPLANRDWAGSAEAQLEALGIRL